MKKLLILILLIAALAAPVFSEPVAGVSGITGNTGRASSVSLLIEKHIIEILKKNGFSAISPEMISKELTKFNCVEEKCILKFAEDAGIDLIIKGRITDNKNSISILLESFGTNIIFSGKVLYKYEINIPMDVNINSREFSLISEEHAAALISRTLDVFLFPVNFKQSDSRFILSDNTKISGKFNIYRKNSDNSISKTGEAEITEGIAVTTNGEPFHDKSFILLSYKNKSDEIRKYYSTRKREIVFGDTSFYDTLFMTAVIPVASASMPVASPFLGYYMNNDWSGLGLWMINAAPYLYAEARGFINSPRRMKEDNQNISRDDRALNYFAWYMLAAGGMPLFIDSYTGNYLHQASYFSGKNQLLGNSATAAILSLTSNGAGHFYRGDRYWGYFYFHLNNTLLYLTLREISVSETYNPETRSYIRGERDRKRIIAFSSIFALSKTIEIIHSILKKEDLSSGETIDEYILPEPVFSSDYRGKPVYGVNFTLMF